MESMYWSNKHSLLLFLFALLNFNLSAQSVSNVTAEQSGNSLIISYSLESDAPCEITFNVSTDGGKTWRKPLKGISGDVGANISKGNHNIIWEVLENQEELVSNKVKFKVTATKKADSNKLETFKTVKIGSQIWMAENLNTDRFSNGELIPEARTPEEWEKAGWNKQPAWCYYDYDPENGKIYGKLYNWYAINDTRGLAPKGWHVPSDADWDLLIRSLGGIYDAAKKMKSMQDWRTSGSGGNGDNSSLFNGKPGGTTLFFGYTIDLNASGHWWSSTDSKDNKAGLISLYCEEDIVIIRNALRNEGYSARLIKSRK